MLSSRHMVWAKYRIIFAFELNCICHLSSVSLTISNSSSEENNEKLYYNQMTKTTIDELNGKRWNSSHEFKCQLTFIFNIDGHQIVHTPYIRIIISIARKEIC